MYSWLTSRFRRDQRGSSSAQVSNVHPPSRPAMYKPLPHSRCTRLLTFESKTGFQWPPFTIRLRTIDMEDQSDMSDGYEALSYTWGSPLADEEAEFRYGSEGDVLVHIISDDNTGHLFTIGRNLFEALSHIWAVGENTRSWWIDSICINQADAREKDKHVLLMSEIYSRANTVFVWFGAMDAETDEYKHLTWLHSTVTNDITAHTRQKGQLNRRTFVLNQEHSGILIEAMGNYLLPGDALRALFRFYTYRRYLQRAWVLQEVSLAQKCMVMFGDRVMPIYQFTQLSLQLGDLGGFAVMFHPDQSSIIKGRDLAVLGTNMHIVKQFQLRSGAAVNELRTSFAPDTDRGWFLAVLASQLSNGIPRSCEDPRDIIYALLGFAKAAVPQAADPIEPDYDARIEAVYTHVTQLMLRELPYCNVLSLVVEKPNHKAYVSRLPSWVPDFATNARYGSPIYTMLQVLNGQSRRLSAAAGDSAYSDLSIVSSELKLYGRRCSQVDLTFHLEHGVPVDDDTDRSSKLLLLRQIKLRADIASACLVLKDKGLTSLIEPLLRVACFGALTIANDVDFRLRCRRFLYPDIRAIRSCSQEGDQLSHALNDLQNLYDKLEGIAIMPTRAFIEADMATEQILLDLNSGAVGVESILDVTKQWAQLWTPYIKSLVGSTIDTGAELNADDVLSLTSRFAGFMQKMYTGGLDARIRPYDTFFTTDKQHVGRITCTLQPGDELWLICRATVPFVLRPAGDGTYRLLGEAYVHGGMQGEMISRGEAGEAHEITIV